MTKKFLKRPPSEAEFIFDQIEDRILLSADILPIAGDISAPGEIDRYSFSLEEQTLIYFDVEDSDPGITWRIQTSEGTLNRAGTLTSTELRTASGQPFTLAAGDYVLELDGQNDFEGQYAFRLMDLGAATAVGSAERVATQLNPEGRARLYQIEADVGTTIDLTARADSILDWALFDEAGKRVFSTSTSSVWDGVAVENGGTHYLIVDGDSPDTGQANAEFSLRVREADTAQELGIGGVAHGVLLSANETDVYRLTVPSDASLLFDSLLSEGSIDLQINNAYGLPLGLQLRDAEHLDLAAGTYEIEVRANSGLSRYGFRLLDPSADATLFVAGEATLPQTDLGVRAATARVADVPPGRDSATSASYLASRDQPPSVFDLANPPSGDALSVDLWLLAQRNQSATAFEMNGLTVRTRSASTDNLNVDIGGVTLQATMRLAQWQHVAVVIDGTTARLFVGGQERDSATLATPAVLGRTLSFGGGLTDTFNNRFDGMLHGLRMTAEAFDADGVLALGEGASLGPSTLHAFAFDEGTGAVLRDAVSGIEQAQSLELNRGLSVLSFDLVAGERFSVAFDAKGASLGGSLIAPSGAVTGYTNAVQTASETGTYRLVVDISDQGPTEPPEATLARASTRTQNIGLDGLEGGAVLVPLETIAHEFEVVAETLRLITPQFVNLPGAQWRLIAPDGTPRFEGSMSQTAAPQLIAFDQTGTYRLEVFSPFTSTGEFDFEFTDPTAYGQVMVDDNPVSMTVNGGLGVIEVLPSGISAEFQLEHVSGYRFPQFFAFDQAGTFISTLLYGTVGRLSHEEPFYLVTRDIGFESYQFNINSVGTEAFGGDDFVLGLDRNGLGPYQSGGGAIDVPAGDRSNPLSDGVIRFYSDGPRRVVITEAGGTSLNTSGLTLLGPEFSRAFGLIDRDAVSGAVIVDLPMAGSYSLTGGFRGVSAVVSEVAAARPLPAKATTTITSDTDLDLYEITAAAGQQLVISPNTGSFNQLQLRLMTPAGETLALSSFASTEFVYDFTEAGSYILLVQPDNTPVSAPYIVTLNTSVATPIAEPYTLGTSASSIGTSRLNDVVRSFTLNSPRTVHISVSSGNVTLRDANGDVRVIPANQSLSDSIIFLPAGPVTLTSQINDGWNQTLRVTDLETPQPLAVGAEETLNLSQTGVRAYAMELAAGTTYGFDISDQTFRASGTWILRDSNGVLAGTGTLNDGAAPFSVPDSGTYTLVVTGQQQQTFAVRDARPPAIPVSVGDVMSTRLRFVSETQSFSFTLGSDQTIIIDPLTFDSHVAYQLVDANGVVLPYQTFTQSVSQIGTIARPTAVALKAGSYTLQLSPTSTSRNEETPVEIRLLSAAGALLQAGESARFDDRGSAAVSFEATADTPFGFEIQRGPSTSTLSGQMILIDPDGVVLRTANSLVDMTDILPAQDGRYTLVLAPNTQGFDVTVTPRIPQTQNTAVDLAVGTQALGPAIVDLRPGERSVPESALFGGQSAVILAQGATEPSTVTRVELGVKLPASPGAMGLLSIGNLRLSYNTQRLIVNVGAPTSTWTIIADYSPGGWSDIAIDRDAATGEIVLFVDGAEVGRGTPFTAVDLTGPWTLGAGIQIYDPQRGYFTPFDLWGEVDGITLKRADGTVAYAADAAVINASDRLFDTSGIAPVIAGQLARPGDTASYSFTLTTPKTFYFDTLRFRNATAHITGGDGTDVTRSLLNNATFTAIGDQPLIELDAGSYTLTVTGDPGDFVFRMIDIDAVATLVEDRTTARSSTGQASEVFTFDAQAGEEVLFNLVRQNTSSTNLRLIAPSGSQVVYDTNRFRDTIGPETLKETGRYVVVFDGNALQTLPSEAFTFSRVRGVTRPIVIGAAPGSTLSDIPNRVGQDGTGSALDLQGDTYIDIPDIAGDLGTGPFALDFWINPNAANTRTTDDAVLFQTASGENAEQPSVSLTIDRSNRLQLWVNQGVNAPWQIGGFRTPVTTDTWTHIAAVFDPNARRLALYRNGVLSEEVQFGIGGQFFPATLARFGASIIADEDESPFIGGLDGLRIWDTALESNEILSLAGGNALSGVVPLAHYVGLPDAAGEWQNDVSGDFLAHLEKLSTDAVFGRIDGPAETVALTFSLSQSALLYLDPVLSSDLTARLIGPNGQIAEQDLNRTENGAFGTQYVFATPGDYRLELTNDTARSAAYGLRLLDLLAAPRAELGTPIAPTGMLGGETTVVQFDGLADGQYFFDFETAATYGAWRLIGPRGQEVSTYNSPFDRVVTLPEDGPYYLLLIDDRFGSPALERSVTVHRITTETQSMALDTRIDGAIANAGQIQTHTFEITSPTTAVFDALATGEDFYWALTGPNGTVAGSQRLDQADHSSGGTAAGLYLAAGQYTLVVDGSGDATGGYAFQLLDLDNAVEITPGGTVATAIGPTGREIKLFGFDATTRDVLALSVDTAVTSSNLRWRVFDPSGRNVLSTRVPADFDNLVLKQTGSYVLAVDGPLSAEDEGAISFALSLSPTTPDLGAGAQGFEGTGLTFVSDGTVPLVSGSTAGNRAQLRDVRDVNSGGVLWFARSTDGPQATLDVNFELEIEGDATRGDRAQGRVSAYLLDADIWGNDGIRRSNDTDGSLEIRIDLRGTGADHTASILSDGRTFAAANRIPIDLNTSGPVATHLSLEKIAGGALLTVTFTDAAGTVAAVFDRVFVEGLDLDDRRLVLSSDFTSGSTSAGVFVDDISVTGTDLTPNPYQFAPGDLVSTDFTEPNATQRFHFEVAEQSAFYFDSRRSDGSVFWKLGGKNFETSLKRFSSTNRPSEVSTDLFTLDPGQYWIEIETQSGFTGTASFVLHNITDASELTLGTDVVLELAPGNGTTLRSFEATAGTELFLDIQEQPEGTVYWVIIAPDGTPISAPQSARSSTDLRFTPDQDGTHTLLVFGAPSNTQPTTLPLSLGPTARAPEPVTLDTRIEGAFALPGERVVYSFDLATPTEVFLDVLAATTSMRVALSGPVSLSERTMTDQRFTNAAVALPAGRYQLEIYSETDDLLGFAFTLRDETTPMRIDAGTPAVLDFELNGGRQAVEFDAVAGAQYTLEPLVPNSIFVSVFTDEGRPIKSYTGTSVDTFVASTTGTYRAYITSTTSTARSIPVRLNALDQGDVQINVGDRIEGAISVAGEVDRYTFNLVATTQLYVDAASPALSDMSWRLIGPVGTIDSRTFRSSDGRDASTPPLYLLKAGTYTLEIDGSANRTSGYAFSLIDIVDGTPLIPGTVVDFTSGPGGDTSVFRFDAAAGEAFYLDTRGFAPGTADIRIVDPLGAIIHSDGFEDIETLSIARSGTYTILIEARIFNSALAAGSFSLLSKSDVAPTPVSTLEAGPGADLVVRDLSVAPEGSVNIRSGGQVRISWNIANDGEELANGTIQQRVIVRNVDLGEIVAEEVLSFTLPVNFSTGASSAASALLTLPDSERGAGQLEARVVLDVTNSVIERNQTATAEGNNTAALGFTSVLASDPDLVARDLTLSPQPGYLGGDAVSLNWQTANIGREPTQDGWRETVEIRNTTSGQLVASAVVDQDPATPLPDGAEQARTVNIVWPAGQLGTGRFEAIVRVDTRGAIQEEASTYDAEQNNSTTLSFVSAPDLKIDTPSVADGAAAGGAATVQWVLRNAGNAPVPAGLPVTIEIRSATSGQRLVQATVDLTTPLAVGAEIAQSATLSLPLGALGTGTLLARIVPNSFASGARLFNEVDLGGAGLDTAQVTFVSAATPVANLVPTGLTAPESALGGTEINISYTVENRGTGTVSDARTDQLILRAEDGNSDDIVLAEVSRPAPLSGGATDSVSLSVTLPIGLQGAYRIVLVADSGNTVAEPDGEGDNAAALAGIALTTPTSDLAVTTVLASPVALNGGDQLSVAWRVTNTGPDAAPAGMDRVYVSASGALDANAIEIGSLARADALGVGVDYNARLTTILPLGLDGTYTVLVLADADGAVFEGEARDNNLGAAFPPLVVRSLPAADLTVSNLNIPTRVVPGQVVELRYTLANAGSAIASAPWSELIRIDEISGARSFVLQRPERQFDLAPGASLDVVTAVEIPDTLSGSFELSVLLDTGNTVFEGGFEGGAARAPVNIATPDLVASAFSADSSTISGQEIKARWTISNTGDGTATGPWVDRIWLSPSGTAGEADDILLGEVARTSALAVGASYDAQARVVVPLDARGDLKLVLEANATGTLKQGGQTANDTATRDISVAITTHADLAVSEVTAPQETIADPAVVNVSWRVANQGDSAAGARTDQVIASRNDVLGDDDDVILATVTRDTPLGIGAEETISAEVALPLALSGRFTLFVLADSGGSVFEDGKLVNNAAQLATPFDVSPAPYSDLVVSSVQAPDNVRELETITLRWRVENTGISATDSGRWIDTIRLINADDPRLTRTLATFSRINGLDVGQSYETEREVLIPRGLAGRWQVEVETATSNRPYEFIYTENTRLGGELVIAAAEPRQFPNLVMESVTAPEVAGENTVIDVVWQVRNAGSVALSGSWTDTVSLQQLDETGDPTGLPERLGTFLFSGDLDTGTTYTRQEEIRLPARISGPWALVVETDSGDNVDEDDRENDNALAAATVVQITPDARPDLQVLDIEVPGTLLPGQSAQAAFTIINQGTGDARDGAWRDSVYLSLDSRISADDILIDTLSSGSALDTGETYRSVTESFVIPERYRGDVFVIVRTDSGDVVGEFPNDENNTAFESIFIEPVPLADLVVSEVASPSQVFEGAELVVNYTVTNLGAGATNVGEWTEQIWLTQDKDRPSAGKGDILLRSIRYTDGELGVDAGYDREVTVQLPDTLPSGAYFITPWVDPFGVVLEDTLAQNTNPDDPNEFDNNNYRAGGSDIIGSVQPVQIVPPPPPTLFNDVTVADLNVPAQALGGETIQIDWTITNSGQERVLPGELRHVIRLYDGPTADENFVEWVANPTLDKPEGIDPGNTAAYSATLTLPPRTTGQTFTIETTFATPSKTDQNLSDNSAIATSDVRPQVADLQVTEIEVLEPAFTGEPVRVRYVIENTGPDATYAEARVLRNFLFLSRDPSLPTTPLDLRERAVQVGLNYKSLETPLRPGESYEIETEIIPPAGEDGDWTLYVVSNVGRTIFDPQRTLGSALSLLKYYGLEAPDLRTQRIGQVALPVTYREANLVVTDVVTQDWVSGRGGDITYTVTNTGTRETREDRWNDQFFLSLDDTLDSGDHSLNVIAGDDARRGSLAPGESYTHTVTVRAPFNTAGTFKLLVATDGNYGADARSPSSITGLSGIAGEAGGLAREFRDEFDNTAATDVLITPSADANLVVETLAHSDRVLRGQTFDVSYTVRNVGADTRETEDRWQDVIYLSRDDFFDPNVDIFLGSVAHEGGMQAGSSYDVTRTFEAPVDLPNEAYRIVVVPDPILKPTLRPRGAIYEGDAERDNVTVSPTAMIIETPPTADLVVGDIIVPSSAEAGGALEFSYTITNDSSNAIEGRWTDAFYLSEDGVWDLGDRLIGRLEWSGGLEAGASYTQTAGTLTPAVMDGRYRIIVRPDIFDQVIEGPGEANNSEASSTEVTIAVPELRLDEPLTFDLAAGAEHIYRLATPPDATLFLDLDVADPDARYEVLLRAGEAPTGATFDETGTRVFDADVETIAASTEAGDYYVIVRGLSSGGGSDSVTLNATLLPLSIRSVQTDVGGQGKFVTTTLTGAEFDPGAIVKLRRPGIAEFEPVEWKVVDSATLIASFDLSQAPYGLYDISVTNPNGETVTIPYRFLVERQIEGEVSIGIGGPRVVLAGEGGTYSIGLENQGNLDAPYTFVQIGVPQLNENSRVFGLPFQQVSTNLLGSPDGAAGSANANVRFETIDPFYNQGGQLVASGFLYDLPAAGFWRVQCQSADLPRFCGHVGR